MDWNFLLRGQSSSFAETNLLKYGESTGSVYGTPLQHGVLVGHGSDLWLLTSSSLGTGG